MKYIITLLLLIIIIKEYLNREKLIFKTEKKANEITIVTIIETLIVILTIILAKFWIDYLIGIFLFSIVLIKFFKQGITNKGILIGYKIKQLYKFNELKKAEIILYNDIIEVVYYNVDNSVKAKQIFDKNSLYKILNEFKAKKLSFLYKE